MSIELLVKAVDHPNQNFRDSYLKGYIVYIKDYPNSGWGIKEGLPNFVVVRVNDDSLNVSDVEEYMNKWESVVDYEVLSSDPDKGEYEVRVFESNVDVSGIANLTKENVENALLEWNINVDSFSTNEVIFTMNLWQMVQSDKFWEIKNISVDVDFSLDSYTPSSGIANITATNVSLDNNLFKVRGKERIEARGGVVIDETESSLSFSINRTDLLNDFKRSLRDRVWKKICLRRYYFNHDDVDIAIANEGFIEITKTQLLNRINDRLSE